MGETGVCKKGMKRSKWEEFEQDHQFKLTRNPKPFDDSAFREKKWRFQNFLLSKLQRREGYLTQNKKASVNRQITLISGKLVHVTLTSRLNIAKTKFSNLIGYQQMSCFQQE